MKAATVKQIKEELVERSPKELVELCLHLSKFKKENKELLTYLLYEAGDEANFVKELKIEIDEQFENVNRKNYYFMKKGIRKILTNIKKHIRYSKNKETEVELLIYFCISLKQFSPSYRNNLMIRNLYRRQVDLIKKKVAKLHEDLQFDYAGVIEEL